MNDKPTYQELENQITELKKQNESFSSIFSLQNKEKEKRVDELKIVNIELENHSEEKEKLASKLFIANIKLEHKSEEKEKHVDELKVENIELEYQSEEKGKHIDELKVAKEKLEKNEIQLIELNATKDKLFSIIAHDLRSPFNGIIGFSELLIENVNEFEIAESEKYLGIINSSAKNTLVLLDNLLHWAKSQSGQINFNPKKLILSSIIQGVIKISNSKAKIKDISLNQMKSDEIEVYTDENLLTVVLRNLISNAIKFTKPEGEINVFAKTEQNHIEIIVSDNGVGMIEKTRKNLFDISNNITTKGTENEKGSGLGLVLCKEFVDKLGGNIWVESELGKGSDFKFTLPLKKPNE